MLTIFSVRVTLFKNPRLFNLTHCLGPKALNQVLIFYYAFIGIIKVKKQYISVCPHLYITNAQCLNPSLYILGSPSSTPSSMLRCAMNVTND